MVGIRKLVTGSVAAAMMISSSSPAFAGWGGGFGGYGGYGGYGDGYGRHRHHDRVDVGDVIGVIAVVGIFAAIASAASKAKRDRGTSSSGRDYPDQRGNISSENAAVDACATATEQRGGEAASVRDIQSVRTTRDGWDVEGTVEQRSNWRDHSPEKHRFTCTVRYGSVDSVNIDGDAVALR